MTDKPKISLGGKLIYAMRVANGRKNRREFAEYIGFSLSAVYGWEKEGINPNFDTVNMIAEALGFTICEAKELLKVKG